MTSSDVPGPPWHINDANGSDIDKLVAFAIAMAQESERKDLREDVLRESLAVVLEHPSIGRIFIARDAGAAVGYIMVSGREWSDWRNGTLLWVTGIYVQPEYRRQGVRKALYEHLRGWARAQPGVLGIRAYVHESNQFNLTYMRRTSYGIIEEIF